MTQKSAAGGGVQQALPFATSWGGARKGAGRKLVGARRSVAHRARPEHRRAHPVHVTLRAAFRPLRSEHVFPTVCLAIRDATRREPREFRVVHFSVQWDHVHLIVEASDKQALCAGVRSVTIRIARAVNALVSRRGRFWADRWHGRELATPRQVRNALVYVFANFRKHTRSPLAPGVDAFSSAARFDGWRGFVAASELPRAGPPVHDAMDRWVTVARAETWLIRVGWRRHGLLRVAEAPSVA